MLVEKEMAGISFQELKKLWKQLKSLNCVLVGGWAAHLLVSENFKKERNREYIGSKDIDFGILGKELLEAFKIVEKEGYFPLSFRYCKIYSMSLKRFVTEEESKKLPIHDLFYLFVDFIVDEKPSNLTLTIFEDELIKFVLENSMFVERKGMRIIIPEILVLSKLRTLKFRDKMKRIKDVLDALIVFSFSEFESRLFFELSSSFNYDKILAKKTLEDIDIYLKELGFSEFEIKNLKTSFLSILK